MTFEAQLTQWYGAPRARTEVPATDVCLIGSSLDLLRLAAHHVTAGDSVSIISDPEHAHWFVPHPANITVTHAAFFRRPLDPEYPEPQVYLLSEVWNDRGLLLYDCGWRLEALECFCRSVDAHPHYASPWVNFGRYFMEPDIRDHALADLCLQEALRLNPKSDMAWANRAVIALTTRTAEEAVQLGETAFAMNAENAIAHLALGQAYAIQMRSLSGRAQLECARKALWHARRVAGLLPRPDIVRSLFPHLRACEAVLHTPRATHG